MFSLAAVLAASSSSCSSAGPETSGRQEVALNDRQTSSANKEVFIDDAALDGKGGSYSGTEKGSQELIRVASDNSKILSMSDGYGNKTETRTFSDGDRLKSILLRTAADGKRQAFVYSPDGVVKTLPEELLDRALTAPASEIAAAVGMFGGKIEKMKPAEMSRAPEPLQPSQYPVQPVAQTQTAPAENPTAPSAPATPQPKTEKPVDLPQLP